jgi:hypothetical protein
MSLEAFTAMILAQTPEEKRLARINHKHSLLTSSSPAQLQAAFLAHCEVFDDTFDVINAETREFPTAGDQERKDANY